MDGIGTYNNFIAIHKPQLVLSGVPEHFWHTLCKKLQDQIFDSGLSFQLVLIDYEGTKKMPYDPLWSVIATCGLSASDPGHIYLIDHAWTFKPNSMKSQLRNIPGLVERMCSLMQITGKSTEENIKLVTKNIWKYAHSYAIAGNEFSVEDRVPVWYVLDELGSGITHSDEPNFRLVPFIHVPDQQTYTLLFPIQNVEEGDMITRNFVEGQYSDALQREAMLIPWKYYDFSTGDFIQEEPDKNYFLEGHIVETLPNLESLKTYNLKPKLKVFSEYNLIREFLTASDFEIVENPHDADILWYTRHFKSFAELSEQSPDKFINQFPFEYVITIKDLLAIVARRCIDKHSTVQNNSLDTQPCWLPTTFNMKTELSKLVSYYNKRKSYGLDNHWICKPYNLARGLDIYITSNLNFLCRLPLTGPKIAQKYIENPVLFDRPEIGLVKFDIRFSNKPFQLNNFEDYEQHFTVMNYSENTPLYRVLCKEFKDQWAMQYTDYNWTQIESSIFKMISELFHAATSKEPPCGIARSPQSRAIYAVDIMLSWVNKEIQPKLLEVNWMPDCRRACEYYVDFYNDLFTVMFLNKDIKTCTKL